MSEIETGITEENLRRKRGRRTLLAIVAIFILPFIILPLLISPEQLHKTNKGDLIEPHIPLAELHLMDIGAIQTQAPTYAGKWTLLYIPPATCDDVCVTARYNALYTMRQVRLAMDKDTDRIGLLLVTTEDPDDEFQRLVKTEFGVIYRAHIDLKQAEWLSAIDPQKNALGPAGRIFLMSPDGYIFMSYPTYKDEHDAILHARDIRSDLKKSLKGSRIG